MIMILGKNGSGKTYIATKMREFGYNYSPNYTTREIRDKEINQVDYNFVDRSEFERLLRQGFFVEYKNFNGNYYGTPISSIASNAVLVAGNRDKIMLFIDRGITYAYICSSLEKRYERILRRRESVPATFKRMHEENFDYLSDFNAIFIDNEHEQGVELLTGYINRDGNFNCELVMSNRDYCNELVSAFDLQTFNYQNDELLLFLKYEEYLLMDIVNRFNIQDERIIREYYLTKMIEFAKTVGFQFIPKAEGFSVDLNNETHNGNFEYLSLRKKM